MSKDLILERLAIHPALGIPGMGWVFYGIAIGAAVLTAVYMTRLMYYVFWSPRDAAARGRTPRPAFEHGDPALGDRFLSLIVGGVWVALLPGVNGWKNG